MRLRILLPAVLSAVFAVGCGSSNDSSDTSTESRTAAAAKDAFPVTIDHKYGSTTIEAEPKRVVVVGLREQDSLLALGKVPVATSDWYGDHPGGVFPWAKDEFEALGGETPAVLDQTDGLPVEKVAAQRPDLILGVYSGMTKKEYDALSKFAPVVAQPKGKVDYGSTWQDETLITGQAIGKPEEAQQLVDETEEKIADAAAAHPEFKGQTAAMINDYEGIFVYGPQDVRTRMLVELGFTYPEELREAFKDQYGAQLSDEKVEALDVGALVWFADGERSVEELKSIPVYEDLQMRKEGRDVFILLKDRVYESTSFPSVLSLPLFLDEMVPRLAAAADGDPKTPTAQEPKP